MIKLELEEWPIVRVTPPRVVADDELKNFLSKFDSAVRAKGEEFAIVLDLRQCEKITTAQRRVMTDHMAEQDGKGGVVGTAMVFESRLLRGILTAMFWVHRPQYPTRVFNSLAEAKAWTDELIGRDQAELVYSRPTTIPPQPSSVLSLVRPSPGSWILQLDASRDRDEVAETVDHYCAQGLDVHLCARMVSAEFRLWVGWMGPYTSSTDAFMARDELGDHGLNMTVAQWEEEA
jgi:hypothetical protein